MTDKELDKAAKEFWDHVEPNTGDEDCQAVRDTIDAFVEWLKDKCGKL